MHPKQDVEAAITYATTRGFRLRLSKRGHSYGTLYCPLADREGCRIRVASTPKNARSEMNRIIAAIHKCPHWQG